MTQKVERPSTSKTNASIEKICQLVYSDHQLTICIMADRLEIAKETVRTRLMEKLGMQKVCAEMVTQLLTPKLKENHLKASPDILQQLKADVKIIERVITEDKSWIFQDDPKTKQQNHQSKIVDSPRPKKARMPPSKIKVVLSVPFKCKKKCKFAKLCPVDLQLKFNSVQKIRQFLVTFSVC